MEIYAVPALVASLLPLLIAVLKQTKFPAGVNAAIAFAVYVIAGVLAVATSGLPYDFEHLVPMIALFTGVGTVTYQAFWRAWGEDALAARTDIV